MNAQQVRRMHAARPFQAFGIHLADSRAIRVEHPEQLAISPGGRTIGVARPDDTIETIDLLLVVSLKPRPNGTHPRRGRRRT
jgi:hypothetical protein